MRSGHLDTDLLDRDHAGDLKHLLRILISLEVVRLGLGPGNLHHPLEVNILAQVGRSQVKTDHTRVVEGDSKAGLLSC